MPPWHQRERRAQLERDLAECRKQLRNGSRTFLIASMMLPRRVHDPACALYAFCRQADDAVDIADHNENERPSMLTHDKPGPPPAARDPIGLLRERLDLAYSGTPGPSAADRALAWVVADHDIPRPLFDALLEGFQWDAAGRRYATLEDLLSYAARVAGTVGAMMALLMGVRTPGGLARACELGVAMQLSNIARDVGEDARMGRLYLPTRWLAEAGINADGWMARPEFTPALACVVNRLLGVAEVLNRGAGSGIAQLPASCRVGIDAARRLYAEIGHQVQRNRGDSVSSRAVVGRLRKAAVLSHSLGAVLPRAAFEPAPALPAVDFLVKAALRSAPHGRSTWQKVSVPSLRSRLIWTLELFSRLEHRDRASVADRNAALR